MICSSVNRLPFILGPPNSKIGVVKAAGGSGYGEGITTSDIIIGHNPYRTRTETTRRWI